MYLSFFCSEFHSMAIKTARGAQSKIDSGIEGLNQELLILTGIM
jgi:hypothetical protein